jgi:hypothetical protein
VNTETGSKITQCTCARLGFEGWVVRSGNRGVGVAGSFWQCAFASIVW